MKLLPTLALVLCVQACATSVATEVAQPAPVASPKPPIIQASAVEGKQIYTGFCARCHGLNMVSTGAGFFDLRQFPADDKPRFLQSVTKGIRAMPAWGDTFSPAELEQLWAYVLSAKPK
jgi:cytochrome c55X